MTMRKLVIAGVALVLLAPLAYAEAAQSASGNQATGNHLADMLKNSGYTDIRVAPEAYMIHARDADGNPLVMSISPDSFSEVRMIGMNDSTATKPPGPSEYVKVPKAD